MDISAIRHRLGIFQTFALSSNIVLRLNHMTLIYKILPDHQWQAAVQKGHFMGSPIDIIDGFIHFSDGTQVRETAQKHFQGQPDLVLVTFNSADFGDALKWEASRGGALFPHLYGPIASVLALSVISLPLDSAGIPVIPELGL